MTVASQNDRKKKVWVAVWLVVMCLLLIVSPFAIKAYSESDDSLSHSRIDCEFDGRIIKFTGWLDTRVTSAPSRRVMTEEGDWVADIPMSKCFVQPLEGASLLRK